MNEVRETLSKLVSLEEEEWSVLASCLHEELLPKKSLLLKEGEICTFIAFVSTGAFRYYYLKDGIEKVTSFFFSKDFVSDYSSFLSETSSIHYIESISASVIYKLYKKDLMLLYDKYKNIEKLGRLIAENLFLSVDKRLNAFLYLSPEERYKELMNRNPNLSQQVPQYMIASYLGVEPETISRIRKRNS